MKAQLKYCPDLRACVLEDRLVPVIPNELGGFLAGRPQPECDRADARRLRPDEFLPRHRHPRVVRRDGLGGNLQHARRYRRPQAARRRPDRTGEPPRQSSSARGPTTSSPRSSRWSRATPSPTTPSMPPPSSVVCWGTGPTSCPPSRSIGAACRCPPRAASRRRRPANGPGRIRMRGPSIRCRFGSGVDHTASHRAPRGLPSGRTRIGRRDRPGTPSPCGSRVSSRGAQVDECDRRVV